MLHEGPLSKASILNAAIITPASGKLLLIAVISSEGNSSSRIWFSKTARFNLQSNTWSSTFFVYQVESAPKTPPYQNSKECDDANCSVIC